MMCSATTASRPVTMESPVPKSRQVVSFIQLALEMSPENDIVKDPLDASLSVSSPIPPPLDQVTICSDDSSTSYSSVSDTDDSSDEEEASEKNSTRRTNRVKESRRRRSSTDTNDRVPRSIFKQYWSKNGGGPGSLKRERAGSKPLLPSSIMLIRQDQDSDDEECSSCAANTYEKSLKNNENKPNQQGSSSPAMPRRSIFKKNCLSQSTPTLLNHDPTSMMMNNTTMTSTGTSLIRKTKSTSALRKQSCLRACPRYSGTLERTSSTTTKPMLTRSASERSVNFDSQVKVALYEKSMERYAHDGWSDYFA